MRRHWIFWEALLTDLRAGGDEEFLGFILGGKESSGSLRRFSASPYPRRLNPREVCLVIVAGNPGLLRFFVPSEDEDRDFSSGKVVGAVKLLEW